MSLATQAGLVATTAIMCMGIKRCVKGDTVVGSDFLVSDLLVSGE